MNYFKLSCLAVLLMAISACSSCLSCSSCSSSQSETPSVHIVEPYKQDVIALENLQTRVVAHCHASETYTAEECAEALEREGFVRLNEVPKFVAEKDFLKTGTYPTRRWRDGDVAPRW